MVRFIQAPTYNDVILIGYAFRNHWMWFNGHIDPSIPTVMYSFVIWKDYNCKDWKTLDQPTSFSAGQQAVITNLFTSITKEQIINDPWKLAKSMVDSVQASSEFVVANDRAYSIVFSQDFFTSTMYSRICVVGQNYYNSKSEYYSPIISDEGLHYGQFILFRTRWNDPIFFNLIIKKIGWWAFVGSKRWLALAVPIDFKTVDLDVFFEIILSEPSSWDAFS